MKPLVVSHLAQSDLRAIGGEPAPSWGADRHQRYLDDLMRRVLSVARHPERHPLVGASRPGIRRVKSGRHIIFYRDEPERVVIVRVLDERSDYGPRL